MARLIRLRHLIAQLWLYCKHKFVTGWNTLNNSNRVSPRLSQISSVQDTPELLGFLRNTSAPHHRHKRAVTATQSYSGKTLVSLTYRHILSGNKCSSVIHRCFMCLHSLRLFSASLVSVQNCTNISCLRIVCAVGRLDRRQSAVVKIRSRLWVHTFLQVSILTFKVFDWLLLWRFTSFTSFSIFALGLSLFLLSVSLCS